MAVTIKAQSGLQLVNKAEIKHLVDAEYARLGLQDDPTATAVKAHEMLLADGIRL